MRGWVGGGGGKRSHEGMNEVYARVLTKFTRGYERSLSNGMRQEKPTLHARISAEEGEVEEKEKLDQEHDRLVENPRATERREEEEGPGHPDKVVVVHWPWNKRMAVVRMGPRICLASTQSSSCESKPNSRSNSPCERVFGDSIRRFSL